MNLQRSQYVPLQQLHPGESAAGTLPPPVDSPAPPASGEQPFFRLDLLRALQMHRLLALGIAMTGLALSAAYIAMKWPVYTAQSQVYIQPVLPKVLDQGAPSRWPSDATTYDSFIEQQVQSATHPEVLLGVLHKLGPGVWQKTDESEQAAALRMGQSIDVSRIGSSYQVAITAHSADPTLSATIANAMAQGIVERASNEQRAGDAERQAILRDEQDRVQKELDSDRTEQETLNAKLGVAAIASTPDNFDADIGKIHEELVKARTAHDEAASRLISLGADHELASKAMNAEADELVVADPGLGSMKMALNQRRAVLISQMANLTPNHPQYKQDAEELAQIDSSLDSMMKDLRAKASVHIQQRLRTDLDRTAGVEGRLNAQLGQLTGAAASATPKLQRANDLATDIVRLQNRRTLVDEQLHNLMLEDNVPGAAHLSVAAVPPTHPTISGILRKVIPLSLGGIILGLLAALTAYNLDSKVYIAADIEHVLGFAPLVQLPNFTEVSAGVVEEHMLRLAATIDHARQQGKLKSFIFTGTGPGAGVTTLSTKIKATLEVLGSPSVMVDASGTPPPIQRDRPGVSGLQDTSPVASERGSSTALLQRVSEETEGEESLVLTDAAPLSISAETEYLARHVDAAIVVVESGVTTRAQLRDVADALQRLDVGAVGFVLNRVLLKNADPAFRDSVRATEKHLRKQSRSLTRRAEKKQPPLDAASPKSAQALRAEERVEPAVAPMPVARTVAHPAPSAIPELSAARPEPLRVPRMPREEQFAQAAPLPASNIRSREFVPQKQEMPLDNGPLPAEPAQQTRVREPQPVPPQPAAPAPKYSPPAPSWEQATGRLDSIHPEPTQEAESPSEAANRLSGLRGLIFSLDMKNRHKSADGMEQEASAEPSVEPLNERPAYAHTYTPIPENPVRREAARDSSAQVTAAPEFLPPKPPAEETTSEPKGSGRRDRRDAYDDVDILPSWHGQYRKR
jgi:uncharacterized protein involved in exopolysaccharide biosynthesis